MRHLARKLILTACLWTSLAGQSVWPAEAPVDGVITGAGAHFAWTIFDGVKNDLEKLVGKEIVLYGKNSMLGQGCNAGIKMAKQHTMEHQTFGFLCCPLSQAEQLKEEVIVYPLALEPIVILLNESNHIANLSLEQVRAIFRGEITNWKQVGGKDQAIVVVTRLHCADRPGHWKTILPDEKAFRNERLNVKSDDEVVVRVTDFEGAIGYAGATWLRQPGLKVKPITVDGLPATAANLANKSYPFFSPLSAVTVKSPSPDVLKIIREVQVGAAFRKVAKQYELLPLNRSEDL